MFCVLEKFIKHYNLPNCIMSSMKMAKSVWLRQGQSDSLSLGGDLFFSHVAKDSSLFSAIVLLYMPLLQ